MIELLENRVAIVPLKDPEYAGSIIIPDSTREDRRPDQGIIYQRGPTTVEVKRGDHVLFSPYSGTKLTLEDVGVLYILKEEDVLAILDLEETDIIITRGTVKRLMEVALDHMLRSEKNSVSVFMECMEAELDGYTSSRGFEF